MLKQINGNIINLEEIIPKHFLNKNNFANWIQDQINTDYHKKFINPIYNNVKINVLDIGANCGMFAAYIAPISSRIVCVEPDTEHFDSLKIVSEALFNDATLLKVAVSDVEGVERFYKSKTNSAMNSLLRTKDRDHDIIETQVQTTTINNLIEAYGPFDYVKIDIEGGEEKAISCLTKYSAERVKTIHIEYHPDSFGVKKDNIINHLIDVGYEVDSYNDVIYAKRKTIGV